MGEGPEDPRPHSEEDVGVGPIGTTSTDFFRSVLTLVRAAEALPASSRAFLTAVRWRLAVRPAGRDVYKRQEQGVLVRGTTRIGQGARVGAYAILTDAVIPAGCVVAPFSQLDADAAQA